MKPRVALITGIFVFLWLLTIPYYARAAIEQGRAAVWLWRATEPPEFPFWSVTSLIGISAVEIGALYLIIRPWSFNRSWPRILAAILIFTPWACYLLDVHEDPPGLELAHGVLVLVLVAGLLTWLLILAALAFIASLQKRQHPNS